MRKITVFYTCHSILCVSKKLVCVDVWFIDLAVTMKELLYVNPWFGACFFACGLACKVG